MVLWHSKFQGPFCRFTAVSPGGSSFSIKKLEFCLFNTSCALMMSFHAIIYAEASWSFAVGNTLNESFL